MGAIAKGRTLFEKIWQPHIVREDGDRVLLYIDRHYLSDDLPTDVYRQLFRSGRGIRRPDVTFAMPDHYPSSSAENLESIIDDDRRNLVIELESQARDAHMAHFGLGDPRRGIVHVVGPEQGLTLPGMTIVCGDSHTSTHGAFGAYAVGIGASEVGHVLATQTLWQFRPKTMRLRIKGTMGNFLVAKDMILHIIRSIGTSGASGYALEYAGQAVQRLTMEGRMTLCNMSIEAGARIGLIAPDEKTLSYLKGRPYAPAGQAWDACSRGWLELNSDPEASFDREVELDVSRVAPAVSWGIDPSQNIGLDERVPSPDAVPDERARAHALAALDYMGLRRGMSLLGLPVDRVFIGSCTNGRIEDLRQAAQIIRGRKVRVPTLIVPGSGLVKRDAEAEGLDRIFIEAGASWGEPGCSMCIAVNGDGGRPGERCVSTTNRNFIGRQGPGVRTHIANPWLAASAAVEGRIVDYREKLDERTV